MSGNARFALFFVFALVWVATNRFEAPDQNLVASSDVTVQQTAPGVTNDITERYLPGYLWVDQTGGAIYAAEDTTDGAAVWTDITAGGSTFNSEEADGLVTANVSVLDFGAGFDLTDLPAGETNVVLDYTEDPVNLSGAEVTGTLDLSDHVNLTAGTGATLTGDSLSVDLGTAIDTTEITDGTILEADLAAVDTAADEECLTFEATVGDFEWQACASGGSGTVTTLAEGGTPVGDPDIVTIDFGAGFTLTETPDTEINITLDYTEDPVNLASAEITGTLAAANGGTGQTAATADGVLVANGSAFVVRVVPDCDSAGNALNFDITTDAWSCRTGFLTTVDISADTNLTCGTNCTLTGDEISVDDSFILNTGDVGTGAYDFGGASDFEIPNSAGGAAVNAAGEITIDTTSETVNYHDGTEERVLDPVSKFSITIEDPTSAEDISIGRTDVAITIIEEECVLLGSATPSVTITLRHGTDRSAAGAELNTSGNAITSTTTGDNDVAFNDATVVADSFLWIETTAQSGTVTEINCTWYYNTDE